MDPVASPASLPSENAVASKTPKSLSGRFNPGDCDPHLAGAVETNIITEATLMAMGLSYLNQGARSLEAAHETAKTLRAEYNKAANRHMAVKLTALAAEALLMAYYGYGAIEHYTGFKDGTKAVAINSAISGGISVTRAAVQYGLMKRGEECFKAGDKTRGWIFTGIGIGLAAINSIFVAVGFADKYVKQEQGVASSELDKIAAAEAKIHEEKAGVAARINSEIDALDKKLAAVRDGASDPRIAAIEAQMKRLEGEIDGIRNHPNFNDGKETEWDRTARVDMTRKEGQVDGLAKQKENILATAGTNLTPEQQQMVTATTQQRLQLNKDLQDLETRYQPQIEAIRTSRKLWEARLGAAAEGTDSFSALGSNPTILVEALANVAAISVCNWWAAQEGYKEEVIRDILAGAAVKDPWAKKGADEAVAAKAGTKTFMGYDTGATPLEHMHNQHQIEAFVRSVDNAEAMRVELQAEVTRQYGKMVKMLHDNRDTLKADEYSERLASVGEAYKRSLDILKGDAILEDITRVMSKKPPAAPLTASPKIPEFEDPEDPAFAALPSGRQFKVKGNKDVMVKL